MIPIPKGWRNLADRHAYIVPYGNYRTGHGDGVMELGADPTRLINTGADYGRVIAYSGLLSEANPGFNGCSDDLFMPDSTSISVHVSYGQPRYPLRLDGFGHGSGDDLNVRTMQYYLNSCMAQQYGVPDCEIDIEYLADPTLKIFNYREVRDNGWHQRWLETPRAQKR